MQIHVLGGSGRPAIVLFVSRLLGVGLFDGVIAFLELLRPLFFRRFVFHSLCLLIDSLSRISVGCTVHGVKIAGCCVALRVTLPIHVGV